MCVCVGGVVVMCGCFDNFVGILVIRVLVFTVFLYCLLYVNLFLFVTSVRTTANNNNNNYRPITCLKTMYKTLTGIIA